MLSTRKLQQRFFFYLGALLLVLLAGCAAPPVRLTGEPPIEPVVPGENKDESYALKGHYAVKSADVQILDLSVTEDGAMAAVASASRTVLLLEREGRLRWEKQLNSLPLKTYLDPAGKFVVVGTLGGRAMVLNIDQSVRFEHTLDGPVGLLSVAQDGELLLFGVFNEDLEKAVKAVVMDKLGRVIWEKQFSDLLDVKISTDKTIYLKWQEGEELVLGAFSGEGNSLWEVRNHDLLTVADNGKWLVSSQGKQIVFFNESGQELWRYTAAGTVRNITFSNNSMYVSVLVRDEATQQEELLYLDTDGQLLWSKRLPDESDILISHDGRRIIIASWRQYRNDSTVILVYNERGQEVNNLEVAGRVQRMALSGHRDTLVLGLEDGGVYFIKLETSIVGIGTAQISSIQEQRLHDFYRPVNFSREKDESILTLFFYDQNAQALIPVTRRIRWTPTVLRASVEELIRGPVQGSQLQRTIPKEVEIGVSLDGGVVLIDLPSELDKMAGTTFLSGILDSLLLTVSQFPTVESIRFTVDGKQQKTFGQEGLLIDEDNPSGIFELKIGNLVFIPYQSGTHYYLLPVRHDSLPLKEYSQVDELVGLILEEAKDFFPDNTRLNNILFQGSTIYLDFSSELAQIIRPGAVESVAKAALIRDAITLSLTENLSYTSVGFLVDGQPLEQPEGYLPWTLSVSRPYFINEED